MLLGATIVTLAKVDPPALAALTLGALGAELFVVIVVEAVEELDVPTLFIAATVNV